MSDPKKTTWNAHFNQRKHPEGFPTQGEESVRNLDKQVVGEPDGRDQSENVEHKPCN